MQILLFFFRRRLKPSYKTSCQIVKEVVTSSSFFCSTLMPLPIILDNCWKERALREADDTSDTLLCQRADEAYSFHGCKPLTNENSTVALKRLKYRHGLVKDEGFRLLAYKIVQTINTPKSHLYCIQLNRYKPHLYQWASSLAFYYCLPSKFKDYLFSSRTKAHQYGTEASTIFFIP